MEMFSWMKKVDMTMDKLDLLDIIDHMHDLINTFLVEIKSKEELIKELKAELEKQSL